MAENFPKTRVKKEPDLSIPISHLATPQNPPAANLLHFENNRLVRNFSVIGTNWKGVTAQLKWSWIDEKVFRLLSSAENLPPPIISLSIAMLTPTRQFERHYRFAQHKIEIEFPSKWISSIAMKIWAI